MYSIHLTEKLASFLSATPYFDENRYTVYTDVPVSCIRRKLNPNAPLVLPKNLADKTINWLICKEDKIVLAVAREEYDAEDFALLTRHLKGMRHLFLRRENDEPYDVYEYDVHVLDASEEFLTSLYEKIFSWLQEIQRKEQNNLFAHRRKAHCGSLPPQNYYCINTAPLEAVVAECDDPSVRGCCGSQLPKLLSKKRLLRYDGSTTNYGKRCGLFYQYESGRKTPKLAASVWSANSLHQALQWQTAHSAQTSLAEKLQRLNSGLPSDEAYTAQIIKEVQKLLDTPLSRFFAQKTGQIKELNTQLERAERLCSKSYCPIPEMPRLVTYRDCLAFLHTIQEYIAGNDSFNFELHDVKAKILKLLAFAAIDPSTDPAEQVQDSKRQSLQSRINALQSGTAHPWSIFRQPLPHYYYASACMTQCSYPLWVYRQKIRPNMNLQNAGDEDFDLVCLLKYALSLADEQPYSHNSERSAQLLYDLLVAPLCGE